jgi:hypothetical protein
MRERRGIVEREAENEKVRSRICTRPQRSEVFPARRVPEDKSYRLFADELDLRIVWRNDREIRKRGLRIAISNNDRGLAGT